MFSCGLIINSTIKLYNEQHNILLPTEKVKKIIKDNVKLIYIPKKLPMICTPKQYKVLDNDVIQLGGYLLNDEKFTDPLIIKNNLLKKESEILKNNKIYTLVNYINSVGYKINIDVLNFILYESQNYYFNDELIDIDYIHPLQNKEKLTKQEKLILESFYSKKFLQQNILNIANAYKEINEFFLPVRLDFRGRLYCITEYLNYQSTDLAKSLLLFSKPNKITKLNLDCIKYLKIFGANSYGNTLDKQSAQYRKN